MRGTKGGMAWLALAVALLVVASALSQPEIIITCIVAAVIFAIWGVIQLVVGRREDEEEPQLLDGGNQIVLFSKSDVPDGCISCPHCGEVYGVGIRICPRCGRDRNA